MDEYTIHNEKKGAEYSTLSQNQLPVCKHIYLFLARFVQAIIYCYFPFRSFDVKIADIATSILTIKMRIDMKNNVELVSLLNSGNFYWKQVVHTDLI